MLRIDDNPVARYPEFKPLEEDLGCWSVAHVKSRQEKAFAHDLVRAGIPYYMYMPLVEKRTRRRDNNKIRKSLLPLFPGYIAIALPWDERDQAYKTHRLANMIPVEDQALFVKELDSIRQALESKCALNLLRPSSRASRFASRTGRCSGWKARWFNTGARRCS
jgi:hypothetical protein